MKSSKMALFNPENWVRGNVTPTPAHVTTFQADSKGFGQKYMPGLSKATFPGGSKKGRKAASFSEAVELFRSF